LLVGLHESLEFDVELSVLARQHIAVVLQRFDFGPGVVVAAVERLVGEAEVILFSPGGSESLVGNALFGLEVIEVG